MRKFVAVIVALAVVAAVALHYHWRWIYPSTYFGHGNPAAQNGKGTCGTVADVHFAVRSRGQPTFIDLGKPYPDQDYTIIIWRSNLNRFTTHPSTWEGHRICVTGHVKSYHGKPEIIAYGPDQIQIQN